MVGHAQFTVPNQRRCYFLPVLEGTGDANLQVGPVNPLELQLMNKLQISTPLEKMDASEDGL